MVILFNFKMNFRRFSVLIFFLKALISLTICMKLYPRINNPHSVPTFFHGD